MKKKIIYAIILLFVVAVTLYAARVIYQIDPDQCNGCGECFVQCPNDAIYYDYETWTYQINPELCDGCGDCVDTCNHNAIHEVVSNGSEEIDPNLKISCFPNPLSSNTTISYDMNNGLKGEIVIFNIKGRKIRSFPIESRTGQVSWDGKDRAGNKVAEGIYFYKLKTGDRKVIKKLTVIK